MTEQTEDATTDEAAPNEAPAEDVQEVDTTNAIEPDENGPDEDTETFPRAYVEELREEAKSWRIKAQRTDELAQRLHTELVKATGKLADATDLPFSEDHLDNPDTLLAAVTDLVARKPHLAARKPVGDIGQGATRSAGDVSLVGLLRGTG